MKWLLLAIAFTLAAGSTALRAEDAFRTDSGNPQLPWYRLKTGEFPPAGSEHRLRGELVDADYIHRSGQFRAEGTAELLNFTLLPYACVYRLNAEADLRDIPLGTRLLLFLYQDEKGIFSKAAVVQDDCTQLATGADVYRVVEVKPAENKISVTRKKPGDKSADGPREDLVIDDNSQIFKGDQRVKLADLAAGDEVLANFTGDVSKGTGHCTEMWAGEPAQKRANEEQRKKHIAFVKQRGIAAQIDGVIAKKLVITFFGDPAGLTAMFKECGIDPEQWAKEHRGVHAVVANEELRTYNPPVDNQQARVVSIASVPTGPYGCSGSQWTIETNLLIEGFRKGRVIRVFFDWPMEDMPFGEGLYTERHDAKPEEESINQYSYRTDFGNENLPWVQLKSGEFPPFMSQHTVIGELLKIDAAHRSGQFRVDRSGEIVDFTLPAFGYVQYLNSDAELSDLPLGVRYAFSLYQDGKGAFTRAAVITDEFTRFCGETLTWRIESIRPRDGKIFLANQLAVMKDDKDHDVRPPDLGHAEFAIDNATRIWKGDAAIQLSDLAVGDELLMNPTGSTMTSRSRCAEIWVGLDTHKRAIEKQRANHLEFAKQNGLPAWIESVDGKRMVLTFFAGNRRTFQDTMNGEPQTILARLADDDLHVVGDRVDTLHFRDRLPEQKTAGTYGSAGVRWVVEADTNLEGYQPGRVVRVLRPEWSVKAAGK